MQTSKPLKGIRVLELGAYISGPYAGALLASLGADVVKVEAPSGDAFRRGVGVESHYFVQYNAGKKSLAVNHKDPRGVELIKSMLPQFDVFIENSRPREDGPAWAWSRGLPRDQSAHDLFFGLGFWRRRGMA